MSKPVNALKVVCHSLAVKQVSLSVDFDLYGKSERTFYSLSWLGYYRLALSTASKTRLVHFCSSFCVGCGFLTCFETFFSSRYSRSISILGSAAPLLSLNTPTLGAADFLMTCFGTVISGIACLVKSMLCFYPASCAAALVLALARSSLSEINYRSSV